MAELSPEAQRLYDELRKKYPQFVEIKEFDELLNATVRSAETLESVRKNELQEMIRQLKNVTAAAEESKASVIVENPKMMKAIATLGEALEKIDQNTTSAIDDIVNAIDDNLAKVAEGLKKIPDPAPLIADLQVSVRQETGKIMKEMMAQVDTVRQAFYNIQMPTPVVEVTTDPELTKAIQRFEKSLAAIPKSIPQPSMAKVEDLLKEAVKELVKVRSRPIPIPTFSDAGIISAINNMSSGGGVAGFAEDSVHASGATGNFVLGIRRDSEDSPVDAAGDYHPFVFNEVGRLKTAGAPAIYSPITGAITASGQSVSADVSAVSNVVMYLTGTFAGHNVTFEGSIDGGTTWFGIQAVRTNANTVELVTGALAAAPAYAWELSVNALTNVRVRATAHTSGTANWRFILGSYATEPIPAIQTHAVTGSGTFTVGGSAAASLGKLEDAVHATGDNGVPAWGVRYETPGTAPTSAAGDYGFIQIDDLGKQVVSPYAPHVNQKQVALAAITDTNAVALFAAAGAGVRTYLTSITLVNTSATATVVEIRDNVTVIHRVYVPANGSAQFDFPTPLKGTANTAMNVACVTTATNTFISATAYNAL